MARLPALRLVKPDGSGVNATRASAVYDRLRHDIVTGQLPPQTRLRIGTMSVRYAVGVTPLREALNRLSTEGLVDRSDQRGFSVAGLDWEELTLLQQTRCDVESLAFRQSIELRTPAWEDKLVLLLHRLGRTDRSLSAAAYVPNPAWEDLHREFHRALLANCRSRWLRTFSDVLSDEVYRFRQIAAGRVFSLRNVQDEHTAIFEAANNGQTDAAIGHLVDHYTRTRNVVLADAQALGHLAST